MLFNNLSIMHRDGFIKYMDHASYRDSQCLHYDSVLVCMTGRVIRMMRTGSSCSQNVYEMLLLTPMQYRALGEGHLLVQGHTLIRAEKTGTGLSPSMTLQWILMYESGNLARHLKSTNVFGWSFIF